MNLKGHVRNLKERSKLNQRNILQHANIFISFCSKDQPNVARGSWTVDGGHGVGKRQWL